MKLSVKHSNRVLLKWMLILLWGIIAVFLSRQAGISTSELSYGICEVLRRFFEGCGVILDIEQINYIVRKLAHIVIYLVLGGLAYDTLACTIKKSKKAALSLSVLFCLIASTLDEAQKLSIPGRHCDVDEIALDSIVAVVGILVVYFLRRNRENKTEKEIPGS